ncbi:MAG: hypothetical protein KDJ38_16210 [Gammaproteobacteria bacterium]|nr:hypothetical protein [Gammaproteobacteria bacterium]
MKKFLLYALLAIIIIGLGTFLFIKPANHSPQDAGDESVPMPWDVKTFDDGSAEIFGVHLGFTTLQEVIDAWGMPDSIGLFAEQDEPQSIEVFFTTAPIGPMKAKVVLTLSLTDQELERMFANASGQSGTASGASRYILKDEDQRALLEHRIGNLTYIPAYKGLEAEYFETRLGKPQATHQETETAVSWFYPARGLTLLIDDKGPEVFQYQNPGDFNMPAEARPYE